MYYASEVTIELLKWVIQNLSAGEAVGAEIPFGGGRHRSDVVITSPVRLSAIEVKAPRDDIRRLGYQLTGYRRAFLEVSVAAVSSNITVIRRNVPPCVGLMVISEDGVEVLRRPSRKRRLSKDAALGWLKAKELRKLLTQRAGSFPDAQTIADMRDLASRLFAVNELSTAALKSAYARILPRFNRLTEERGAVINEDDLRTLTIPDHVV